MRVLLDTHALLWWLNADRRLTPPAREAIAEPRNMIFVSAASAWEVSTKYRLGKLPIAGSLAVDFVGTLVRRRLWALDITVAHGQDAGALPGPHRDPFDRLLVAQALAEHMALVSNETAFDAWGVVRIW